MGTILPFSSHVNAFFKICQAPDISTVVSQTALHEAEFINVLPIFSRLPVSVLLQYISTVSKPLAIADTSTLSPTLYVSPSVGLSIVNS
jgi:hypothetical protein